MVELRAVRSCGYAAIFLIILVRGGHPWRRLEYRYPHPLLQTRLLAAVGYFYSRRFSDSTSQNAIKAFNEEKYGLPNTKENPKKAARAGKACKQQKEAQGAVEAGNEQKRKASPNEEKPHIRTGRGNARAFETIRQARKR